VTNLFAKHAALTEYCSVFPELFQENCDVGLSRPINESNFDMLPVIRRHIEGVINFYFTMAQQPPSGPRPPHCQGFIFTLRMYCATNQKVAGSIPDGVNFSLT
jgi:hypothetical protein